MPRRLNCLTLFAFVSIVLTAFYFFSAPFHKRYPSYHDSNSIKPDVSSLKQPPSFSTAIDDHTTHNQKLPPSQTLHVSITETGGSHDEVVAALVHSFGSQPAVQLSIYQLLSRYGISDLMRDFDLSHKLPAPLPPSKFPTAKTTPDILVSATCELDIINKDTKEYIKSLLTTGKTYLFCIVHHSDRWGQNVELEQAISPWIEKGRIEFITLSPHTATYFFQNGVKKWKLLVQQPKIEPIIKYLVPVFPINITEKGAPKNGEFPVAYDEDDLSFALQGDFDPSRRDYKSLFSRLSSFLKTDSSTTTGAKRNLTLQLLGHGARPNVPPDLITNIKFNEALPYIDYYTVLSKTFALLPAFASLEYLDRKASSSVPASLIAGVPLVATEKTVSVYGYLNQDIVWLQKSGEEDMDVVGEILKMTAEQRRKKKQAVVDRRNEIIKGNVKRVGDWVEEALQNMGR